MNLRIFMWSAVIASPMLVQAQGNVQAPAAMPKFDVASVKLNGSGSRVIFNDASADRVLLQNMPLPMILRAAYGMTEDQIAGLPGWAKVEYFDVIGKMADADIPAFGRINRNKRYEALRPVLEERFALKFHNETRELSVYTITVAKGGPKMKAVEQIRNSAGELSDGSFSANVGNYRAEAATVDLLAKMLSGQLQRPVVNQSALDGHYTFTLHWDTMDVASPGGVSLYAAMTEQLGLRLEAKKLPMQVMVIDHIEEPSAN